ncbi:hypothetical protein EV360DRAFT_71855 [Lentinula raphanica]|nr:hypothetical protein EV360DRAFT_71855 [Lentinula raphanica]
MVAQRTPKTTRNARQNSSQSPSQEVLGPTTSPSPRVLVTYAGRKKTPTGCSTRLVRRPASLKKRYTSPDSDYTPSTDSSDQDEDGQLSSPRQLRSVTREAEIKKALEEVNAELSEAQQVLQPGQQRVKDEAQALQEDEEAHHLCSTCADLLYQPYRISLACGHSFCVGCLSNLARVFFNGKQNISCPECRAVQGYFTPIMNFKVQSQVEVFMRKKGIPFPEREELYWPPEFQSQKPKYHYRLTRGTYPVDPSLQQAQSSSLPPPQPPSLQSTQRPSSHPAPAPFPVSLYDD